MKKYVKYIGIGILVSLFVFFLFGIITALLQGQYYTRMVPVTSLDYFFLVSSSLLIGTYVSIHYYKKNTVKKCNSAVYTGGIMGFFSVSCPVCNKLLLFLLGASGAMTYFNPLRPILGFASIGLLTTAIYFKVKN